MTVQGPVKEQQPDGMSHRGAGPPPPPKDQSDHRGKKRNVPLGKSDRAIFWFKHFCVPDPPLPLLRLPSGAP